MQSDATTIDPGNGDDTVLLSGSKARLMTRADLDGRTRSSKRATALVLGLVSDLGGADRISVAEHQLIEHAAVTGAIIEHYGALWLAGEHIDVASYLSAINAQRRVLVTLGLKRRARDVTPSLKTYLEDKTQ